MGVMSRLVGGVVAMVVVSGEVREVRRDAPLSKEVSPRTTALMRSCHGRSMDYGTSFRALTRGCISGRGSGNVTSLRGTPQERKWSEKGVISLLRPRWCE